MWPGSDWGKANRSRNHRTLITAVFKKVQERHTHKCTDRHKHTHTSHAHAHTYTHTHTHTGTKVHTNTVLWSFIEATESSYSAQVPRAVYLLMS